MQAFSAEIMQIRVLWDSRAAAKLSTGGSATCYMWRSLQGYQCPSLGKKPRMKAEKDPVYTSAKLKAFSFPVKVLTLFPLFWLLLSRKNYELTQLPHYTDIILIFTNHMWANWCCRNVLLQNGRYSVHSGNRYLKHLHCMFFKKMMPRKMFTYVFLGFFHKAEPSPVKNVYLCYFCHWRKHFYSKEEMHI